MLRHCSSSPGGPPNPGSLRTAGTVSGRGHLPRGRYIVYHPGAGDAGIGLGQTG